MLAWLRSLNDRSYAMELLETACCTIEPEAKAVTDKDFPLANLPAHIEQTVRSLVQLHADHNQNATLHERAVARKTGLLAHPRFIGGLAIVVAAWMTLNLLAAPLGYRALDPPPLFLVGGRNLAGVALYSGSDSCDAAA
jgi:uncharacterized membrane protein